MSAFVEYPAMLPAVFGVWLLTTLIITYAEHRWNRPPKPLPPPCYRRKARTVSMRGRR